MWHGVHAILHPASNPQKVRGVQRDKEEPSMKLSRTLIMAAIAVAGTAQAAQVTLFKQPNFSGEALTLHSDTDDLSGSHFQDQVSSVVVQSGRWQVCTMPNFQG